MEISVLVIGVILRILDVILAPFFWLAGRGKGGCVPRDDNPILNYGVVELADKIRSGQLTSEQVVSTYIQRIKFVNCYINAVVDERFDAALEDAKNVDRQLEKARRTGDWNGISKEEKPLFGVPCTVKESCQVAGLSNSIGCLENAGSKATHDGEVVALVKKAGAIPLLVSNTPEYCLGWESTNLLNGTTNNPYKLNRTAGGSSGGEGALLGCGASPFGVASDIAGSIRVPAAFCGVFGHKPTPGIISITGHVPFLSAEEYPRFLAVGPMARRAADLPLLLRVMAGDSRHLHFNKEVDFRELHVFYMTEASNSIAIMKTDKKIKEAIISAVHYLRDECGSKISEKKFTAMEDSVDMSISLFFSMKDIPNMLQDPVNPKREKNLFVELIKYMLGIGSRSLQGLGFAFINKTKLFIPESRRAYYHKKADELKEDLIRSLGTTGVLLYPAWPAVAHPPHGVFARAASVLYTMVFNVLGLPAAVAPLTHPRGLPLSIQIIAAPNQDHLCIAVAKKLEEAFGGWKPPQ